MSHYGRSIGVVFNSIGVIRTPYQARAPYQPIEGDDQVFYLEVNDEYGPGLTGLESFRHIYVLYYVDRLKQEPQLQVTPPWTQGKTVGIFASRSPARPNPIGLSVVRLKKIVGNRIYTSGLDVFDNTPLLDIKPYIKELDNKEDSNYGWIEEVADDGHLARHIQGIPHEH